MLNSHRIVIAAGALLACSPALADPFDTLGPFVQYGMTDLPPRETVHGSDWVVVNHSNANGAGEIMGRGDVGVAKIGAASSGTFNAFAWSGWNDQITLVPADPGLVGQSALMEVMVGYAWSATLAGAATGSTYVDINLLRAPGLGAGQYMMVMEDINQSCNVAGSCGGLSVYAQGTNAPTFDNGIATFYLRMNLGETYTFVLGMNAESYSTGGSLAIDATQSATWAGVSKVSLNGQPLAYSLTSTVGFDYARPVPEPPAGVLLLAGMLALAARRRPA